MVENALVTAEQKELAANIENIVFDLPNTVV